MSQQIKFLGAFVETQTHRGCSMCGKRSFAKNRQMVKRRTIIIPKLGKSEFIINKIYEVTDEVSDFLLGLKYKDIDGQQKAMFERCDNHASKK